VIRPLAFLILSALPASAQDLTMVMVEQEGCIYCARWDAEAAPLRRVDLRDLPGGIAFDGPPVLTPTFVLVRDGSELSRLEGYDPQFFWPIVERMVADAEAGG
jgi:thioredoxin-related protein